MSFVLGFGSIEEKARCEIKHALSIDGIGCLSRWNDAADKYDKMPREDTPERYTRVYYYNNTIRFHHINRRHAFSPDGWACMVVEEPFGVKETT